MAKIEMYSKIVLLNNNYKVYGATKGMTGYVIGLYKNNYKNINIYEIQLIDKETSLPGELIFSVRGEDIKKLTPRLNKKI